MNLRTIVHIAQIDLQPTTGMGRIACEWQAAARRKGIDFVHIGQSEVGPVRHRLLFPLKARKLAERLAGKGAALVLHEPCAWAFRGMPFPKVAFSHGIEARGGAISRTYEKLPLKRIITGPILEWLGMRGLRAMDLILVSNSEDRQYLLDRSVLGPDRIKIFRNGVDPTAKLGAVEVADSGRTIVFNGSWLQRKGITTLVKAADKLAQRGIRLHWLLIGTVRSGEEVLSWWPEVLRSDVTVIPIFPRGEELSLLCRAEIFVLPSFYEGQSLALSQAMAAGLCCITSNCCGQKDLIRHGENGLLFTPGNELELADLIQKASETPSLRHELGRKASISVAGLTWQAVSDEVVDSISHVASF